LYDSDAVQTNKLCADYVDDISKKSINLAPRQEKKSYFQKSKNMLFSIKVQGLVANDIHKDVQTSLLNLNSSEISKLSACFVRLRNKSFYNVVRVYDNCIIFAQTV